MTERPADIYIIAKEESGVFIQYYNKLYTSPQSAKWDADLLNDGNWIVLKYGRPVPYRGQK